MGYRALGAGQILRPSPEPRAHNQPCLCLCRASLQITYTTPRRRTTLQFLQIFLTEARTFIALSAAHGAAQPRLQAVGPGL